MAAMHTTTKRNIVRIDKSTPWTSRSPPRSALRESCDRYETVIDNIAVRVTKPTIPRAVLENFERVEAQRAELVVAERSRELALARADAANVCAEGWVELQM